MVRMTLDDAQKLSLAEAAVKVTASHEPMLVSGPQGEWVKLVPLAVPVPSYHFKGKPVYTEEQLAKMSPDDLQAIGWIYPDESEWVEELLASRE
ncbi:MAG: hypothetical protein M5U26_02740 [Planctomycetota bacterium]|nr:hypothetical protein [Planctomycetota bacterium]